jgi:hypothetical protein
MSRLVRQSRRVSIFKEQKGLCYYCHAPMERFPKYQHAPNEFTLDHLKPRSKGGTKGDNLVGACYKCNIRKKNLAPEIFMHNYRLRPLDVSKLKINDAPRFYPKRATYFVLTGAPKQLFFGNQPKWDVPKGNFVYHAFAKMG